MIMSDIRSPSVSSLGRTRAELQKGDLPYIQWLYSCLGNAFGSFGEVGKGFCSGI